MGRIAKVIANLIVIGSGILLRAVSQAYKQALINAQKTGVAQEVLQDMAERSAKKMSLAEARMILGVDETTPWTEVLKKYEQLFERNAKIGSFYIQSKVYRVQKYEQLFERNAKIGSFYIQSKVYRAKERRAEVTKIH